MDEGVLQEIGMTPAEVKVYIALLCLGSTTAGPIMEKSGLQSSVVHLVLNRLEEKGFVSFIRQGRRKHYQAADPNHLLEYMDERRERIKQILPELLLRRDGARESPAATLFQGVKGVKELLYVLLEAEGKEHHTLGSAKESLMLGDAWWVEYHRKRAGRKIKAKLLFNESLQAWKAEKKYPFSEIRYTKAGFEPLTETILRGNIMGIIIWTEKPIGILIQNEVAVQSYEKYFQILWDQRVSHKST